MRAEISWCYKHRLNIATILLVALFFLAFFWRTLFTGKYLLYGDPLIYSLPLRTTAWGMIKQGILPLWTPLLFSGYPLLSMAQLGLAYPLTWGYLFLPNYWAEQVYCFTPFLLSPLFTFAYAREIGRSRTASLLAGLSFGYGGLMASPIGLNGMLSNAVMWMPLVLIALERSRRRGFIPCLLLASGACTMSVLTGIGQGFVYSGIVTALYAAFLALTWRDPAGSGSNWRARLLFWPRWKPVALVVFATAIAAGIAAFQILETLRAARRSVRKTISYETFSEGAFSFSLAWKSLVEPLNHHIDVITYVAPLALILAVIGFVVAVRRIGDDPRPVFWLGIAVLAWVLMLGNATPLNPLIYHIPFLNRFRVPSRHAFEWTFAVAILAAYGWDALRERGLRLAAPRTERRTIVIVVTALLLCVIAAVFWWLSSNPEAGSLNPTPSGFHAPYVLWKALLAVLTFVVVWLGTQIVGQRWRTALLVAVILLACFIEPYILIARWDNAYYLSPERMFKPGTATAFLTQFPPEQNRVFTEDRPYLDLNVPYTLIDEPNITALHGVHNVDGYEPFVMERYSVALGDGQWNDVKRVISIAPNPGLMSPASHVLDLLNTTYVTSLAAPGSTAARLLSARATDPQTASAASQSERWEIAHAEDHLVILSNRKALPRAWLVDRAESVTGVEALRRIRGESELPFDPRRTALLEVPRSELPILPGVGLSTDSGARVVKYEPARLIIETTANQPSVLVVSEMWYPGWVAKVDGIPTTIHATNFLLRGVVLPTGVHRIEMRYTAPAARAGAIISILSLLLVIAIAIVEIRRQRKPATANHPNNP